MRNGHSDLHPIKAAIPPITHAYNSVFNDLPEESKNVKKSTNIETVQSEEDYVDEVSRKEKNLDVESKSREGLNCGNPIQGNNIKNPHVPTRVSDHAKCVLPSWTRRCRPTTQS